MAKKVKPGYKRCPECKILVKGPRTKTCPKCQHEFPVKQQAVPAPEPAAAASETPTKPTNAITLDQIKMVGQMVKTIGGFRRLHEMLAVIKEVGGLKKFKDLLDAMAVTETDQIPF
jgi:uncharacterized Zn finger protein (UPF0148 family)